MPNSSETRPSPVERAPLAVPVDEEERARRTAKHVLFLLVVTPLALLIVVLLVFFQPDDQVVVTRHESGTIATRSRQILDAAGRPCRHGEFEAWHADGTRAEEGQYEQGAREGEWRFWNEEGELDPERSGTYREDRRIAPLSDANGNSTTGAN